jgi:hypothetical protein
MLKFGEATGASAFNGNYHTIRNINTTTGLFADYARALFSNLTLDNVKATNGALIGFANHTISNVTVQNASISGVDYVGGLVGSAYGNVKHCAVIDSSVVATGKEAGGLIGYIATSNEGFVANNTVKNVYVSANNRAAGLVAQVNVNVKVYGHTVDTVTVVVKDTTKYQPDAVVSNALAPANVYDNTVTNANVYSNLANVTDNAQLKDAITNSSAVVLAEGKFSLPTLSGKEGMTIIGAADGSTVIGGENTSTGFRGNFGKDTTMTNLTFSGSSNGVRSSYANGGETTFNNCVFAGDSVYGFHIDSSNDATFTFNNCTFKGFNAFAGDLEKVIFNNCTFLSNGHYGHTNIWSVAELNNCTFGDKASIGTRGDSAHIFFDGVEESYYHEFIGSAESLVAFQESVAGGDAWKGKKVVLASDIDLAGIEWTPISGFGGTFDGDGYTIANLTVKGTTPVGFFGGVNSTATIKNVTFDNANVSGTHYVAVVLAGEWNEKANATIDNCHVINSTVVCDTDANNDNGDKVGGICGYAVSLNITNCSVKDTTIKAYRDFGGILGCSNGSAVFVSGNTVENVTLVIDNDVNYKNYTTDAEHNANSIVGRMNSGKVENNNVK